MNTEISEIYLEAFFGNKSSYYIERWKEYKDGTKVSFKPYAFIFGIFWFLHRKMYKESIVILVIFAIFVAFEEYLLIYVFFITENNLNLIEKIDSIFFNVVLCFIGNFFYMKSSERKIRKILLQDLTESERINTLTKAGGTNWYSWAAILLIFIVLFYLSENV